MQITLTIPDAIAARVIAALGSAPRDGETTAQAARRNLKDYIRAQVQAFEGDTARKSAIEQAGQDINVGVASSPTLLELSSMGDVVSPSPKRATGVQ